MTRLFTLASAALICGTIISCQEKKETTTQTETEAEAKTYTELQKAEWLAGSWGNTSGQGTLLETWEKANDSVYNGTTHFIVGKDTVFSEKIQLEEANGKLTYVTAVSDQNGGKPIRFEMTSSTDKQMVFENPSHDFPQKITYNRIGNDSLLAEISGVKGGKPASEQFPMKRQ